MNDSKYDIDSLLNLFEEYLEPSDVLLSKLMAQISTAITRERLKKHMNQSDFAKYINASQSLVSRWEQGDYNFSLKKIAEIASSLNLDVNISMYNAALHHVQNGIEYSPLVSTFKTSCSRKEAKYSTQSYVSFNLSQKQEETNYASIC
ncbi:MAG: helix-turn-helix transcriptional regulator [Eubacteriales bacterium]|nr:helix-turn-helix transcriptional regulator [Eubacteriales bacterium]